MEKGMTSNEWKAWTNENDGLTAKDLVSQFVAESATKSLQPTIENFTVWCQKKFNSFPPPLLTRNVFQFHFRAWARDSNRTSTEKTWYAKNTRGGEQARVWEEWIRAHQGLSAIKLVHEFMGDCFKNGKSPTRKQFQLWLNGKFLGENPPEMVRLTFNKNKILWGSHQNRTKSEKDWYSQSVRGGGQAKKWSEWTKKHGFCTAKDLVEEFLNYSTVRKGQADLEKFNGWLHEKFPEDQPPEITRLNFNAIKSRWGQDKARTTEEKEWYIDNRNSGPSREWIEWTKNNNGITAQDLINEYLNRCIKSNLSPSQEGYDNWVPTRFSDNPPPKMSKNLFKSKKLAWGNNIGRTREEKAWYYKMMNKEWVEWSKTGGGMTAKDLVYTFMDYCFHHDLEPLFVVFNSWIGERYADKSPPELEEKTYIAYRGRWVSEKTRSEDECAWYAKTVQTEWTDWTAKHDGWTAKKLVNAYMNYCHSRCLAPDQ